MLKLTDIEDRELIVQKYKDYYFIGRFNNTNGDVYFYNYLDISNRGGNPFYTSYKTRAGHNSDIRKPSLEELHWFLECEKAGKFIPKDEAMKSFNTIPEYVECIKIDYNLEIGKIYKIESYDNGEKYGKPVYFINKLPYYATYFKPSTKEAFDLQNNPKQEVVNEPKVGEYWFFRVERSKNDLYKIVKNGDKYLTITGISSGCNRVKNHECNKERFKNCEKWFKAKLEEIPVELLTDDELLELAKEHYPIGTVYVSTHNNQSEFTVTSMDWINSHRKAVIFGENQKGIIHDNGKWAKIVSQEEVKTEYVEPLNVYYGKEDKLEDPNEITIPKVVKYVKEIDFNIEKPTFAEIKIPIQERPRKVIKPIIVEKFELNF